MDSSEILSKIKMGGEDERGGITWAEEVEMVHPSTDVADDYLCDLGKLKRNREAAGLTETGSEYDSSKESDNSGNGEELKIHPQNSTPAIPVHITAQSFLRMCENGKVEAVRAYIDEGCDVNEEHHSGSTGLMRALHCKQNNVMTFLLDQTQIDINKINMGDICALHSAVFSDNHEGMAALLARKDLTTINHKKDNARSPIMASIHQNSVNCFKLLLTHPEVDLDTRDDYERSPEEVLR